jgi:methionyl-tRNA formyltransferase
MRILFAGTPDSAATVLESMVASGHEVVAVLTREDALTGRKKVLTQSRVADAAAKFNIPVIKANKVNEAVLRHIAEYKPELAIVVAYGVILRTEALEAIPNGWFNLHYSLLPMYRGAAPVQHSLLAGEKETGVTLFKIDQGLDTGDILGSASTVIGPDENAGELLTRLTQLGVSLLNAELPALYSGTLKLQAQTGSSSVAPKISRADARIDFDLTSQRISDLVRAMNPEPMAWCLFGEEPMRVLRGRAVSNSAVVLQKGEVRVLENAVYVGCGEQEAVELLEVQPASKTAMSAKDWANGLLGTTTLR